MTVYQNLAGRTAVVTGASSGMGAAIATLFAASGARVALLARRRDRLDELAAKIDGLAVPTDVTEGAAVASAVEAVHAAYGPADLLINAAGVMLPNPITDGREDEWQRMIDLNLTGLLRATRAFAPDLIAAAAAGRTADLVNVSSIGAHVIFPNYAVYGATKAAVSQLSGSLGSELGAQGVRVTNLEPGLTDTELGDAIDNPALSEQLGQMFAAIGPLAADDVADLVGYIASRPRAVNLRHVVVLPTRQG
jgi:NADP-dependent 3-hydroxy acid dehydrogenase YdfG